MNKVHIVYLTNKKSLNHMEILKIYFLPEDAERFKDKFNKGRVSYSLALIKSYNVEMPKDIWFKEQEMMVNNENAS